MASAGNPRVGLRVLLTVFWTIILVAGLTVGVLLAAAGAASRIEAALTATIEATSVAAALAVGMVLIGLWGIASSHKSLRHSVELIAEVDRARRETIQLESSRHGQQFK
ncbi:MAG TPA: hypothetical protein VJ326_02255 [Thermoplasmata archaeon]|nr:hypothetical protein [Thermoplasmata archaeon]